MLEFVCNTPSCGTFLPFEGFSVQRRSVIRRSIRVLMLQSICGQIIYDGAFEE